MCRILKAIFRFIKRLFLFALLLALIVGIIYILPLFETADLQGITEDAEWMSMLPDSIPVNELILPGTHNSASEFAQLPFFTRCQGGDVGEQLRAGFRYLDIRLAVDSESDSLKFMHGFASCQTAAKPDSPALYLDAVLEECYSFLEEHPYETILFAVKQEHGSEPVSDFQRILFNNYILLRYERWLLTDRIPNLGEARGKIVLLRRYEDEAGMGASAGIPFLWADQGAKSGEGLSAAENRNGSYSLIVQDRYAYSDEEKWAAFVTGLQSSEAEIRKGNISLNFLSTKGSFPVGHPYDHADTLNSTFRNRIQNINGWIIVDFGEPYIARMIYQMNFQLNSREQSAVQIIDMPE